MSYTDPTMYHSSGRPVFLNVLVILLLLIPAGFLLDGIVRSMANMPQLHQTHVRYTWLDKKGERQCVVAIREKSSQPCNTFTQEQIDSFRLQYEIPAAKVLAGQF